MKLDINSIERDSVLQDRLKDAARESIRDFFPGREPPKEAVEYVFVAFCLNETKEQFNVRLNDLFNKDCTPVVESLSQFVEAHSEFLVESVSEVKKEKPKKRQKIVWDASLAKPKESEEKKKKSSIRRKASCSPSPKRVVVSPSREHIREPNGEKKRRLSPTDASITNRWQTDGHHEKEIKSEVKTDPTVKHEVKTELAQKTTQLKIPRSRLFESALGSIKQQYKQGMKKVDDHEGRRPSVDGHMRNNRAEKVKDPPNTEMWPSTQLMTQELPLYPSSEAIRPIMPPVQHGSILDRIRKPDGSAFEEWELRRGPQDQVRKQEMARPTVQAAIQIPQSTMGASEVESLKEKVAQLEKEVQKHQGPHGIHILPAKIAQDASRCSICVRNIHPIANEEILAAHFHSCLPILKISFARDVFGRPRNYCFLQFADEASVERALELDRSLLLGMPIQVTRKFSRSSEWRGPWNQGTLKQDWQMTREDGPEIKDFAIDTGSQDRM